MTKVKTNEAVFELASQSQAFRVTEYFKNRSFNSIFPNELFPDGCYAFEAGGTSNQNGRALVVIKGLTCEAGEVLSWLGESFLGQYIHGLLWFPFGGGESGFETVVAGAS